MSDLPTFEHIWQSWTPLLEKKIEGRVFFESLEKLKTLLESAIAARNTPDHPHEPVWVAHLVDSHGMFA